MQLELDQIEFPESSVDNAGRVFRWQGEVYRGIKASAAPFYRHLFDQGILPRLFSCGLVETEIASVKVPGYEFVLKHCTIPFQSYCFEWCVEMLRQAALMVCDLSLELARVDLQLKDAHAWNILFDGCQPKFVDFTSIIPARNDGPRFPYDEFYYSFIYPLQGDDNLVRCLMQRGLIDKTWREGMVKLLPPLPKMVVRGRNLLRTQPIRRLLNRRPIRYLKAQRPIQLLRHRMFGEATTQEATIKSLFHLRRQIEDMKTQVSQTEWSTYSDDPEYWEAFEPNDRWSVKQRNVYEVLKRLQPTSVLDIGCNRGWYSQMIARQGIQVVATDLDHSSLNRLFSDARSSNLPILPLLIDFVRPRPQCILYTVPAKRIRVDLVLALALVHHLVFKEWLRFETIASQLSEYTQRWLLVEFVPPDDVYVKEWVTDHFDWYSLESFMAALGKYFGRIEVMESMPPPRKLLLCEKC